MSDISSARIRGVPNQPKTPMHAFRCEDELWQDAKDAASIRGETLADVLRRGLRDYIDETQEMQRRRRDK